MRLHQELAGMLPSCLLRLAFDARCLWRCSRYGRAIPFLPITRNPTLVIAPHPDDETFGCGGLIRLKREAGVPVRVVLLTDGEAVMSGSGESQASVVAARRRSFVEACQHLGLAEKDLRWLHLPDAAVPRDKLPGFESALRFVLAEIDAFAPGEVYCTDQGDVHPDHVSAAILTRAALRRRGHPCVRYGYPVWMWYHSTSGLRQRFRTTGAWRLDISSSLLAKKQAMAAYLDAPKARSGSPYCGKLPWSLRYNFLRRHELFLRAD